MLTLSALTILYAVLGMAAIYYGESALIGRVHFGIMFGLAIFAVVGVVALVKAQLSCVKKAETFELAQRIELERNKALGAFVMELAGKMAAQMPNTVIAGLAPNFYVTEADVVCLNGRLSGRTMYVSLPLCRMLNLEELKAVLAHELAHYKGLDTRFSQRFYPIYRGASQGLMNLASGLSEKGGAGQVVLLPALTALGYFLNSFSEAEREISRERELTADAEAARVGGSHYLASALVKLHAFSGVWPAIRQGMKEALENGKAYTNASALFETIVNDIDKEEALSGVSEEGPPHPTDTHPPLTERLRNLNLRIDDVIDDARKTKPEHAAIELFADGEELEGELTNAEQAIMIRTGEAQPNTERAASAGD